MVRQFSGALTVLIAVTSARAGVPNLRVTGVTATQAILQYTAPDSNACTVEVSESPSYTPLVHAVDPAMFPGANSDGGGGPERVFVAGGKDTEVSAADSLIYSRALQAFTVHYTRVTCGSQIVTATFQTSNVPFGGTYMDPVPVDPNNVAQYKWPSKSWTDRTQKTVDPITGMLVLPVGMPGDSVVTDPLLLGQSFVSANDPSGNWTNPNGVFTAGQVATYSGSSCSGPQTCDKLRMLEPVYQDRGNASGERIDDLRLKFAGSSCTDASAANRVVDACVTLDGLTCDGITRQVTLTQAAGSASMGSSTPIDTWRAITAYRNITPEDMLGNATNGYFVWKDNNVGSCSIAATYDIARSKTTEISSGGYFDQCNQNLDINGFFHCISRTDAVQGGGPALLYGINPATSQVLFLGALPTIAADNATWSITDPNTYWTWSGSIVKTVYTGNDAPVAQNTNAAYTATTIIDKATLTGLIASFTAGDSPPFDSTIFACATELDVTPNYLKAFCRRGQQQSYGWGVVWKLGDGTPYPGCQASGCGLPAAAPLFQRSYNRFCGNHDLDITHADIVSLQVYDLAGGGTGQGPYTTTTSGALAAGATQITITGEPVSPSPDTSIGPLAAGDFVQLEWEGAHEESVLIASRTPVGQSPIVLTLNAPTVNAHSTGVTVYPKCESAYSGAGTYWDFIADPHATTNTGYPTRVLQGGVFYESNAFVISGGHYTYRRTVNISEGYYYRQCADPAAINCLDQNTQVAITEFPTFASYVSTTDNNTYESHPTCHQVNGTYDHCADGLPFSGGGFTGGALGALVGGFTHVYKVAPNYPVSYKTLPFIGFSSNANGRSMPLREVSGSGCSITDATPFTFGVVLKAGECVPASQPGEVYANVPDLQFTNCAGGNTPSVTNDLCVGPSTVTGLSVFQIGLTPNHQGGFIDQRGTYESGFGYSRVVSKLWNRYRQINNKYEGRELPDSSFMWTQVSTPERSDLVVVKLPPMPPRDTINRSTFVPFPVQLNPPAGLNAVSAVVEFGYNASLYCTARTEVCVTNTAAVNEAAPFWFAQIEAPVAGLACASGCSVVVPAVSQKILYYRWKYLDATGTVVGTSQVQVAAVP